MSRYRFVVTDIGSWLLPGMNHFRNALGLIMVGLTGALAETSPPAGQPESPGSVNVLIITGVEHPAHDWKAKSEALVEILELDPRISVTIAEDPEYLANDEIFRHDVILLNFYSPRKNYPGTKSRANLRRFVHDKGKGLFVLHFACGAFPDWDEYVKMIGRIWDCKNGHDQRRPFEVEVTDPSHPITKDLETLQADDELYICLTGETPVHQLARARSRKTSSDHPMAFTLSYGKGRVFHTPLGHDVRALRMPDVANLIRRGCLWAGGVDPTTPAEPAFVPTDRFTLPDDLEVTIWAHTPLFYNPVNMDFDAQGRLWLIEGMNYSPNFRQRPAGDRVMVIEDTNHDGRADHSHMFVQEERFQTTMGLAVVGNRIFVSQPPAMLAFTDVDGDAKFDPEIDKREEFLTGFHGHDHGHGLYANVAGPDGRFYFSAGNYSGGAVTDRSGRVFRIGSFYFDLKTRGKKSDDGHVYVGGVAYRIDPDGTNLAVVGHNMRNPVGLTISSFGDMFNNDNDDPPNCRTTWLMEYGNLGYASNDGARTWRADQRPGQPSQVAHWRQEDPGIIPAGDVYGGGAPTDIAFYENGALPAKYRGLVLSCEAGRNVVFGYLPKPVGAGFTMNRFDFFTSNPNKVFEGSDFVRGKNRGKASDLSRYFRPSDVTVGPDGAIYVADWFDSRVGGHYWNDRGARGTIYRISAKGAKLSVPVMDLKTVAGQIKALGNPTMNVRHLGFSALKAAGDQAVPALKKLLEHENPYVRVRPVWLLAHSPQGRVELEEILKDPDPQMRLTALRALRAAGQPFLNAAATLASDPSPAVRREVALAMRNLSFEESKDILLEIATTCDGQDRWLLEAFGTGCTGKQSAIFRYLVTGMNIKGSDWPDGFAHLAWRLHVPEAVAALKERALNKDLSETRRKLAIDTLAFIPERSAGEAMMDIVAQTSGKLGDTAHWWINNRNTSIWRDHKLATQKPVPPPVAIPFPKIDPARATKLPAAGEIAARSGDAKRGRELFFGKAACHACHKAQQEGHDLGPDLTSVAKLFDKKVIIESILDPSAGIALGYDATLITTKDKKSVTGYVLSTGDPLLLKDLTGNRLSIKASNIASTTKLKTSIMPTASAMGLNAQDLADVVEFLISIRPAN
ncbi:MAG: dehydrogenase [Roseibacillus sp.]|nr:dehydrogenase [Roseibacillus sp.]